MLRSLSLQERYDKLMEIIKRENKRKMFEEVWNPEVIKVVGNTTSA